MKITKEDVLKIEHEIIDEDDDIWSLSDEMRQELILYYHGAHDMANKIIKKLESEEGITMDVREKLVELIESARYWGSNTSEEIADKLLENGVTVQEWISVKERLPEDASTVLAIDSDGTISSAYYVGRWHSGGDLDEDAVTYWMPLPTAPKEDK